MGQPHDDVDAELVDQVPLDLALRQVGVAVGVQQALRRRDERAVAVDGDRAAFEDHRDRAHVITGVLRPGTGEGGVALPRQVLLTPGVEDPVDGDAAAHRRPRRRRSGPVSRNQESSVSSSTISTAPPHISAARDATAGRGDHRDRLEPGDRRRHLGVGPLGRRQQVAVERDARRPAHHRPLVRRRLRRHAHAHSGGGHAVERQQRAVEVGSAVAEEPPGVPVATSRLEIERGDEHGLVVTAGLGDLGARVVGDERRAVERDLRRLAYLVADAVGGHQRRQVGAGVALHDALPVPARIPSRDPAARCRWPSGSTARRRRAAPCSGPTRGTTGPSRCRRPPCRACGLPHLEPGVARVEVVLLGVAGTVGDVALAVRAEHRRRRRRRSPRSCTSPGWPARRCSAAGRRAARRRGRPACRPSGDRRPRGLGRSARASCPCRSTDPRTARGAGSSCAPCAAASRTRRSAVATLASRSSPIAIWMAAVVSRTVELYGWAHVSGSARAMQQLGLQVALHDLAVRVAGEWFLLEPDPHRHLEGGDPGADELTQLVLTRARARRQVDDGADLLAEHVVGDADRRRVGHGTGARTARLRPRRSTRSRHRG